MNERRENLTAKNAKAAKVRSSLPRNLPGFACLALFAVKKV